MYLIVYHPQLIWDRLSNSKAVQPRLKEGFPHLIGVQWPNYIEIPFFLTLILLEKKKKGEKRVEPWEKTMVYLLVKLHSSLIVVKAKKKITTLTNDLMLAHPAKLNPRRLTQRLNEEEETCSTMTRNSSANRRLCCTINRRSFQWGLRWSAKDKRPLSCSLHINDFVGLTRSGKPSKSSPGVDSLKRYVLSKTYPQDSWVL